MLNKVIEEMQPNVSIITTFHLCLLTVVLSACSYAGVNQARASKQNIHLPVTICLDSDAEIAVKLVRGVSRLRLSIRNRELSDSYSDAFQLFLLKDDGSRSIVSTFGMQPDILEQGQVLPQMFLVSLKNTEIPQNTLGKICFELRSTRSDKNNERRVPKDIELTWQTTADR